MTALGTERRGLVNEIGAVITNVAVPHHEPPAVVLCRRIVVVIVLVTGAALLGLSLSRTPGESRTGRVPCSPALSAGRVARHTSDGTTTCTATHPTSRPWACDHRAAPQGNVRIGCRAGAHASAVRTSK